MSNQMTRSCPGIPSTGRFARIVVLAAASAMGSTATMAQTQWVGFPNSDQSETRRVDMVWWRHTITERGGIFILGYELDFQRTWDTL